MERVEGIVTDGIIAELNITADHYIEVICQPEIKYYTMTAGSSENETIYPSGQLKGKEGEDITFHITPRIGYRINALMVDDERIEVPKRNLPLQPMGHDGDQNRSGRGRHNLRLQQKRLAYMTDVQGTVTVQTEYGPWGNVTLYTIRYARAQKKDVRLIQI